ncbi:MAG: CDP-glucose 4,6-dehydratase [Actinomycetia bacterium]|nr:CDP-glucose 4,6-dehydratase [Actinomycetes bacterium]
MTGHTGFKGAWLSLWLQSLGAEVVGFSDEVADGPSLFGDARVGDLVSDERGDVRDEVLVRQVVRHADPEVVFHLAAQSLVRRSYRQPVETWATNVLGTVNVLDACRTAPGVRALLVVTSDKCYEEGDGGPHREGDPLGGPDPYSSSKAAAELATAAWRSSFLTDDGPAVASVRAGNVIGGGDWSEDRLVPDAVRAALAGEVLHLRNPDAVRPWQDVLDCLHAYLLVAERLLVDRSAARAWNVGPTDEACATVADVVGRLAGAWPGGFRWEATPDAAAPREAPRLELDASDAHRLLGWHPSRTLDESLVAIADWHVAQAGGADAQSLSLAQLEAFCRAAGIAA